MRFFIIILSVFLFSSCVRDYQKELREKIALLEKEGKRVINYSSEKHFIIYKNGVSFCIDDLDNPVKKILSAEDTTSIYYYSIKWNKYDKPEIEKRHSMDIMLDENFWTDTDKRNSDNYVYPYTDSKVIFKEDEGVIYFTYKTNKLDAYGEQKEQIFNYLLYLSRPNELIWLNYKDWIDNYNGYYTAVSDPIYLVTDWELSDLYTNFFYKTCGSFYWKFDVDSAGNEVFHQSFIDYENRYYNKSMRYAVDDFSSREKVINILQAINDTIQKAQENEYINEINEKAIDISDISDCFHNELKAEKDFIGKRIILKCNIDAIEKADGWLDLNGYKYKIISHSSELFGEWMSGYDIIGYTNDDNFIDLSCPNTIIMECILISGSVRRFQFKDCKLILAGKK